MAVNKITNKGVVNKELVNRANEVSTKGTTIRGNRETTIIPGNNFSENYSITLKDVDTAILNHVKNLYLENISIEHLHLNRSQKKNMVNHLNKNGYSYFGNGYDHKNFDYLFKKEKIIWNRFLSSFLWLVSHKKVKYFNKFFFKGSE